MSTLPSSAARGGRLELTIRTRFRDEFVDITREVGEAVQDMDIREGLAFVYVPHTTAGVTINEGADPAVRRDILSVLDRLVPQLPTYEHAEGNSPAHVKARLVGASVLVPVEGGELRLGRWQSVYLCEFDGPRSRRVWVGLAGGPSRAK